jgi:hypothetical protein
MVLGALAVFIALSPLWVPLDARLLRCLAAVNAVMLLVKLYDLHIGAGQSRRPSFSSFLAFLPSPFSCVWRRLNDELRPTVRQNFARLGQALWKTTLASIVAVWIFRRDWTGMPFFAEHCAKTLAVFLTLMPLTVLAATLWRLAGGRARDVMDTPLLAPTPAEFWRRYNRPAQQFFYEDIFKRMGGLRSPTRATLATFAVSALIHEYLFDISLDRVQGYQALFFMLQGLGVIATMRMRFGGWRIWFGIGATWIFNLATGLFFFANVNELVPFYSSGLPNWLSGW